MTPLSQASSRSGTTTLKVSEVLADRPTVLELRLAALNALHRGEWGKAVLYQRTVYRRLDEARESEGVEA